MGAHLKFFLDKWIKIKILEILKGDSAPIGPYVDPSMSWRARVYILTKSELNFKQAPLKLRKKKDYKKIDWLGPKLLEFTHRI